MKRCFSELPPKYSAHSCLPIVCPCIDILVASIPDVYIPLVHVGTCWQHRAGFYLKRFLESFCNWGLKRLILVLGSIHFLNPSHVDAGPRGPTHPAFPCFCLARPSWVDKAYVVMAYTTIMSLICLRPWGEVKREGRKGRHHVYILTNIYAYTIYIYIYTYDDNIYIYIHIHIHSLVVWKDMAGIWALELLSTVVGVYDIMGYRHR